METYTIKQGDTLSNIAKQFGTTVSKLVSNNSIQDPNLIQMGQTIKIPKSSLINNIVNTGLNTAYGVISPLISPAIDIASSVFGNKNPVVTPSEVNIGNLPTTPITPVKENVTVLSYKDNADGTTTNYLSDGTTSTVKYNKTNDGQLQPVEVTPDITTNSIDTTGAKKLLDEKNALEAEISTIEKSIANKSTNRESAYQSAGIFDDVKRLNELKDNLQRVKDEAIAIPIEAKQRLSGRGATATEYSQTTAGDLEENLLKQLGATRAVDSLTGVINTNIALINQKIDDKYTSDTFLFTEKNKRLDNIVKSYGDIMTEVQKGKIEDVKQKNAIELENIKMKNDITKNAAEEAIKADPSKSAEILKAVQSGDISKLYAISGNTKTDPSSSSNIINTVQSMLDNSKGLSSSVGPTFLGKAIVPGADAEKFRADAKNLASQASLDYFVKLKANGATFGAMTEAEWNLVTQASPVATLGINPQTGKSNLGEEEFIKRAKAYQSVAQKAITADALTKSGIDPTILKNLDQNAVKAYYDKYVVNGTPTTVDYTQQDTQNFIQKEEGFSPTAYKDQAGVWTIGYGTTKINGTPIKPTDTITESEAKKLALEQAVNEYSTFADKLGDVSLTPNQFTALNSFEYNLGPGVWNQPSGQEILNSIKKGDLATAQSLMQKFVNVRNPQTGKLEPNPTLIARRQREGKLLLL